MPASAPAPAAPLIYMPSYEKPEEGEAETQQSLLETLHKISTITYKDSGHAIRSVHAKSHGLLRGELIVSAGLPDVLAQGVFAKPGRWPLAMRLSTVPGDILDDNVSTPRGMAIKIVGVEGARLEGSEGSATQDFVMVNGPSFSAPGAKSFAGNLKLLAATTDKAPGLKKVLSAALRGIEKAVEAVGGESATLKALGGQPVTNPLGETYYTQVPMLFGPYMGKFSVAPVSPNLTALTGAPVDLKDKPDGLRLAMNDFFASQSGEWELRVQLCTDLDKMPIENAAVTWPEQDSPYITVAKIVVTPQTAWSEARSRFVDDGMAFNPWHGIAAHRPIGSVMRIRKAAYDMSKKFRAAHNGVSIDEPADLDDFPA